MIKMYALQKKIEDLWPLPTKSSTFNLSVRDLTFTVIFYLVFRCLGKYWYALIPLVAYEPAPLLFPMNVAYSLFLRSPRFWDPYAIEPRLHLLQKHFKEIREETLGVLNEMMPFSDVSVHQKRISQNQPWNVFPLFALGATNMKNCKKMPFTSSILLQIPTVKFAMLSCMEGGAEIPKHCGYMKSVLRVHLCVLTDEDDPQQKRFIDVGGEKYSWKEGDMVAFDDTYPHYVSNGVKGKRVVLFLDVERPGTSSWIHSIMARSPTIQKHAALQEIQIRK